jgi:virulence-associated protein VagC
MTAKLLKLSSKNQLTLPKSMMKHFPNTEYFEIAEKENELVLRPVTMQIQGETLNKFREKIAAYGITEEIIPKAIKYARDHK